MSEVQVKVRSANQEEVTTWINLHQTVRVIQSLLEDRLRAATHLSWPEFELLMRLQVSAGHPLHMGEIADQLVGSPSGTTRIADRLEKDGLIARETPRENRRVVQVTLTARGLKVLAQADGVFREALEERFASHLSETELAELRRLARTVLEKNGAWSEARCSPPAPPTAS